jgi:signal transduction histidine kinase
MEDVLVLDVQDDGRGFVPGAAAGVGYGLTGMEERARRLRGSFSVESTPGEGTTVSMTLPMVPPSTGEVVFHRRSI